MNVKTKILIISFFLLQLLNAEETKNTELVNYSLPIINASAFYINRPLESIPAAISLVKQDTIQKGTEQLSLAESLESIPGVFVQNAYNFAQDTRIAIRGFGARSDFGIRGIKLFVDGIPATTPDGQGEVDGLDLNSAQQIEIIRGPSSALYGAASGGAILIKSEASPTTPSLETRWTLGDYGLINGQAKAGGQYDSLNYLLSVGALSYDGYRKHSETTQRKINTKLSYSIDTQRSLTIILNAIDMPQQNDPGGLTKKQVKENRTQANQRNLDFNGGESVTQKKAGLTYTQKLSPDQSLELSTYALQRDFANRLPFFNGGQVHLERRVFGGFAKYIHRLNAFDFVIGINYDNQKDDRKNYDNNLGERGDLALNQIEEVNSIGIFTLANFPLTETLSLSLALRHDHIKFDVDDHLITDGNDSGTIRFNETSPMLGLHWQILSNTALYFNASTSFETPTTTELDNPNGGGFNRELNSQKSINTEFGIKSAFSTAGLPSNVNLSIYQIEVKDSLVSYELPSQPGRDFFRNTGEERRRGIEANYSVNLKSDLSLSLAYTWSDFTYTDYDSIDGNFSNNQLPGIPEQFADLKINYTPENGFFFEWTTRAVGSLYTDDANQESVDAYTITNLKLGKTFERSKWTVTPFLGVNNLFDQDYNSNIRINAFGGRYFEPAPGRNIYAGFSLSYSFD